MVLKHPWRTFHLKYLNTSCEPFLKDLYCHQISQTDIAIRGRRGIYGIFKEWPQMNPERTLTLTSWGPKNFVSKFFQNLSPHTLLVQFWNRLWVDGQTERWMEGQSDRQLDHNSSLQWILASAYKTISAASSSKITRAWLERTST